MRVRFERVTKRFGAQLRLQTRTELERLHRELGTTMIDVDAKNGARIG